MFNVAIVGCGYMGVTHLFDTTFPFTYSYAGAIFKTPGTKLVALIDSDMEKLNAAKEKLLDGKYLTDCITSTSVEGAIAKLGRNRSIDIICCTAGPCANSLIIHNVVRWGVKGIYCEKPLALSLSEADALAQIEKESGIKIQVNYHRNFDVFHRSVIDYITAGGIGNLLIVRVLYKGGIIAVAPHAFAFLQLLFQQPYLVYGIDSPLLNTRCLEDPNVNGLIRYFFEDRLIDVSVMATGRGDLEENNTYIFEIEFTGTKGRISILENGARCRYEKMELSRFSPSHGDLMPYDSLRIPPELKSPDGPRESIVEGMHMLVDAINTNKPTNCSAATSRDAEEIAHALALSAELHKPMSFPLEKRTHEFRDFRAGTASLREENKVKL